MVIFCSIALVAVLLIEFLFFKFAIKHKAKNDLEFVAVQFLVIGMIFCLLMNILGLKLGSTSVDINSFDLQVTKDNFIMSKVFVALFLSLLLLIVAAIMKAKVVSFSKTSNYSLFANLFIYSIAVIVAVMSFINVFTNQFFEYIIYDAKIILPFSNIQIFSQKIMSVKVESVSGVFEFFVKSLFILLGLFCLSRSVIYSIPNTFPDILCLVLELVYIVLFLVFAKSGYFPIFEISILSIFVPLTYYLVVYKSNLFFAKGFYKTALYENSLSMHIVFDGFNVLAEYNKAAKNFFGFTSNDLANLTMEQFINDYVPIGLILSDSIFIEQIAINGTNEQFGIFQVEYNKIKYNKDFSVCSYFVFRDISTVVNQFTAIQQISVTDSLTGLLSPIVLTKKINEINLYRKYPYTAATCRIKVKNEKDKNLDPTTALVYVCDCIKKKIRENDVASYENGIIVLLLQAELAEAKVIIERITDTIKNQKFLYSDIDFMYGLSSRQSPDQDFQEVINDAHIIMFNSKNVITISGEKNESK